MRAWVLREPADITSHPLEHQQVPIPTPAADQLLIRVRACGICRTDLHIAEGELAVRRLHVIPGHQIVGEVVSVGEAVTEYGPGDGVGVAWLNETCGRCRFCTSGRENLCENAQFTGWTRDGGYAEYAIAPAAFTYPLPSSFSDL